MAALHDMPAVHPGRGPCGRRMKNAAANNDFERSQHSGIPILGVTRLWVPWMINVHSGG